MKQINPKGSPTAAIPDSLKCPRCMGYIPSNETPGVYPGATSRTDDETEVCSECGTEEALETFQKGSPTHQSLWPVSQPLPNMYGENPSEIRAQGMIDLHPNRDALMAFLDQTGLTGTPSQVDSFDDCFLGTWESFEDYVSNLIEDCALFEDVPTKLLPYFDMGRYARDIELEGMTFAIDTGTGAVWIFDWP